MLFRKMLRELRADFGQFFSIFVLSFLAMAMFCTFEGNVLGMEAARKEFHQASNLADLWIYGEGFTEENLEAVRSLDFVESAQLRTSLRGTAPDCEDAQVDIYLVGENQVNMPYLVEGEPFDPQSEDGFWLTAAFAERRGIQVGDDFTVAYYGIRFTKEVKGLIESPEYEFRQADGDADVFLENIAFLYGSYRLLQGVELPRTELLVTTNDGAALTHEEELAAALNNNYAAIIDRSSVQGLVRLDSELAQHRAFSYVFLVVFVGIALLVIATSMSRMVEKQRTQIGTMNACGMKNSKILFHYISFSLGVTLLGTLAGTFVGTVFLSQIMIDIFSGWYIVPGVRAGYQGSYFLISLAVVAVCVLAAYISCRKLLKIKPAEALRPAAPRQGKTCFWERFSFWRQLSFIIQYNIRDISRAKFRAFMGVMGTAVGMLLMVYALSCNGLVDLMYELTFEKTQQFEYELRLSEDITGERAEELKNETDGELVMVGAIEVAKRACAPSDEKKREVVTVVEGKGLYNILDLNQEVTRLKAGTVAVSRKLAEDMDIQIGDKIYWHLYSENDWYEAEVGMLYRSADTQGIACLREDFEKTGCDFTPSFLVTNREVLDYVGEQGIAAVMTKADMVEAFYTGMEAVDMMFYLMLVFSAVMIVVVLYNSGNLSFHERVREFATLKVMGFQSAQIRRLLSVQNLWLSFAGILLGAPFGSVTLQAMMNSNGENFDYVISVSPVNYVLSGVFVLAVSMLVSFLFSGRIRRLDMVEVLKGVE